MVRSSLAQRRLHVVRRAIASSTFGSAQEAAALLDIVDGPTVILTRCERDVQCRHDYLGAALDIINSYQKAALRRPFYSRPDEARLRLVEVLKHWLRTQAGRDHLDAQALQSMSKVATDVLREPQLFASRQERSLAAALTRVYDQLQRQQEVDTSSERSSAKLMDDIIVHAKGALAGTIAVLLLGPTHLTELDTLPSLSPDVLRESLCGDLQGIMAKAWASDCGRLVATLVSMKLFTSKDADSIHDSFRDAVKEITPRFEGPGGDALHDSGLAGPFRSNEKVNMRKLYLSVVQTAFDLAYLFGDVLMPFHSNIRDYGDYGAIRSANLLHPVIDSLAKKVALLKTDMRRLYYGEIEETLIREAHRSGGKLEGPCGSSKMCRLGHEMMEEAISGSNSHVDRLEHAINRLREQSQEGKLKRLESRLADAGKQLSRAFQSSHCREVLGDDEKVETMSRIMNGSTGSQIGFGPMAIEPVQQEVHSVSAGSSPKVLAIQKAPRGTLRGWSWRN